MPHEFSGHIYIFQSFDVGDIIDFDAIRHKKSVVQKPLVLSKYFKNYHMPLEIEMPGERKTEHVDSVKLHSFGVITLRYKIPFRSTLETLRSKIEEIHNQYQAQSFTDGAAIFQKIKQDIKKAAFYHLEKSYFLIQVDTKSEIASKELLEQYGDLIASTLRFETETLSDYKKNDILQNAFGYYRGDLIIIDVDAAFVYDEEYEELLDLFEFVNMQHLELQTFDKMLDEKLSAAYKETQPISFTSYLPMGSTFNYRRVGELENLKVDISVITERLANSIKITGEPYYTELLDALTSTLNLQIWKESIEKKLNIIRDIGDVYEAKIRTVREDVFNVLIIILIFVEVMLAAFHSLK